MNSELKQNLNAILTEKQTKVIPENIKKGVTIFGVEGNMKEFDGQEKTVNPSTSIQEVLPDTGYDAMTKVTVNAVTSDIDENIQPNNIVADKSILGVQGSAPVVYSSLEELRQHMDLPNGTLGIVYEVNFRSLYKMIDNTWVQIGGPGDNLSAYLMLTDTLGNEEQEYMGVGDEETEVADILMNILGRT